MATKTRKEQKICIVDGCNREVLCLDLCTNCYQRAKYWERKTMKQKVQRIQKLQVWENSLSMQIGNVTTARRRKAA